MPKLLWSKFRSPFSGSAKLKNETEKLSVNEEYKEVFRTKSYVEMWSKVNDELDHRLASSSSSASEFPFYFRFSDYLFEAHEEKTISEAMENLKSRQLLIDYFDSSLEACNVCDLLLKCIHQTRFNYRRIKRVIKLFSQNKKSGTIFKELAAYAMQKNPLSFIGQAQFRDIHDGNVELLRRLNAEQRRARRRARLKRIIKKIGGYSLVISHTVLIIALIVTAIHSLVGIVAAPGLAGCLMYLFKKKKGRVSVKGFKTSLLERHCVQLDLAAKGTYILINDFDTMSRLVWRLFDEVEHLKDLADMCARNKRAELLGEVVKEICSHDDAYLEQLEELEKHVYLCFHTINRFRRLLLQEIMVAQEKCS